MIKYHDDGKGKDESHEVYFDTDDCFDIVNGRGFGRDYQKAKEDCLAILESLKKRVEKEMADLQNDIIVKVDCFGNKI